MNYTGVIIEESLADIAVLSEITILDTQVEPVTEQHRTPWIEQWTLHTVEVPEGRIDEIAERVSLAIDDQQAGSWYADFKNDRNHHIIFRDRVFVVDLENPKYKEAMEHGISAGIPWYQLDFSSEIEEWRRE